MPSEFVVFAAPAGRFVGSPHAAILEALVLELAILAKTMLDLPLGENDSGRTAMADRSLHVVIWLPSNFYSAVVSTLVEMFQLVNDVCRSQVLSCEFVSRGAPSASSTGISFPTKAQPSRKMDVLILIAMPGVEIPELLRSLDDESEHSKPLIALHNSRTQSSQHIAVPVICSPIQDYWTANAQRYPGG
ncbi:MAG: hypothetical protein E5W70_23590 [Mesorhizobium sp.]|nr:MAG: hypothetical protein E5W70_23590 [Mesorhizobium sp.]